ncbi:MAG: rhodanese-like domain-containing protein [Leptospiraceae bacterium]|nr:rhodanese-like domain-containing protein [Leptospiraceae bacterium]MCK6380200.1 rhodanese-like domain-containing protein [Leptospiraceae bacterium]
MSISTLWFIIAIVVIFGIQFLLKRRGRVSQNILIEKIQSGAKIIDVRTKDEFQDGHYNKAINIPLNTLSSRLGELGDKSKPIVLYCASGVRSASATQLLKSNGFIDVVNAGGLGDMP